MARGRYHLVVGNSLHVAEGCSVDLRVGNRRGEIVCGMGAPLRGNATEVIDEVGDDLHDVLGALTASALLVLEAEQTLATIAATGGNHFPGAPAETRLRSRGKRSRPLRRTHTRNLSVPSIRHTGWRADQSEILGCASPLGETTRRRSLSVRNGTRHRRGPDSAVRLRYPASSPASHQVRRSAGSSAASSATVRDPEVCR